MADYVGGSLISDKGGMGEGGGFNPSPSQIEAMNSGVTPEVVDNANSALQFVNPKVFATMPTGAALAELKVGEYFLVEDN